MPKNFTERNEKNHKSRIKDLRREMISSKLDGFLIPRADKYQNEFIQTADERLFWLTGFSGSAGMCLVMDKSAVIFVDGRYRTQVEIETDKRIFQPINISETPFEDWVNTNCKKARIGYDPWLHTPKEILNFTIKGKNKVHLVESENLIDKIWEKQPRKVKLTINMHPKTYSGMESKKKRRMIARELKEKKIDAVILTKPDSICWLLNIRGEDVPHNPIVQSMAILDSSSNVKFFVRKIILKPELRKFLGRDVEVMQEKKFLYELDKLKGKIIQVDPASCPMKVYKKINEITKYIVKNIDPCEIPKAIKNKTEIKGSKLAHKIDGSAFTNFLFWFHKAQKKHVLDEIGVVKKLKEFRLETGKLKDISFDTICAFGENGALVHYRVSRFTNKKITKNNTLLIDSGGQYRSGTTDLTRTLAIGKPEQRVIDIYTWVLKGLIAVSSLHWPAGLSGRDIDCLARTSLWSAGLDYDHGTGHGVGSYLSVHEGPQGISRRNNVTLQPGMLLTNEPGYYEPKKFGIRIENVLLVKVSKFSRQNSKQMLTTETLTLAPLEKTLINQNLLTQEERTWINNYHRKVKKNLDALISSTARQWLDLVCSPL